MSKLYGAYRFRTKDPVIDQLRTIIEDHYGHRVNGKDLRQIEEAGGPSTGTMRNWFFGKTRRPTNPTIEAAGRAVGWQRTWQRMGKNEPSE